MKKWPSISKVFKYFNLLLNYLQNINSNKIYVLVSKSCITVAIFKNNLLVNSYYFTNKDDIINYCQQFFSTYRKFTIYLLIDCCSELKYDKVFLPHNILSNNPFIDFIKSNFTNNDIVSYRCYKSPNQSLAHNTAFASIKIDGFINILLYFIAKKNLHFSGIYFLNLEINNIAQQVIAISESFKTSDTISSIFSNGVTLSTINHFDSDTLNDQQNITEEQNSTIFITIDGSTHTIRVIVLDQHKHIAAKNINYPNCSEEYLRGIIEQEISNYVSYISLGKTISNPLLTIIILLNDNLKSVAKKLEITPSHRIITIVTPDTSISCNINTTLLELFSHKPEYPAINGYSKKIKMAKILSIASQFCMLINAGLIIYILAIFCYIFIINIKINMVKEKHYKVSEIYLNQRDKFIVPERNINLLDLYYIEELLKTNKILPFLSFKIIIEEKNLITYNNIKLNSINWHTKSAEQNSLDPLGEIELVLSLNYSSELNQNIKYDSMMLEIEKDHAISAARSYCLNMKNLLKNELSSSCIINKDDAILATKAINLPFKFIAHPY